MAQRLTHADIVAEPARRVRFGYNPALDGLRAIAVFGVVGGHAHFGGRVAGYHGVTVFFVISGYLITSLLTAEHAERGRIALGRFYGRRFARLAPALILVVLVTTVWLLLTRVPFSTWWGGLVGSLTYTTNLFQYFTGNGNVSFYFQYTWSLGLEEQFYLVWPLLLVLLLRFRSSNVTLVVLGIAYVGFWVLRYLQDQSGPTHEAQFYGPISHADALVLGSALAIVLERWSGTRWLERVVSIAGPLGLVLLGWVAVVPNGLPGLRNLDSAGFGQTALFSAGIVAWLALERDGFLAKFLSLRPLVFLGKLSYGIYLWNLLGVFVFVRVAGHWPGWSKYLLIWLAGLILVSWLSYRFVETPLRLRFAPPHAHSVIGPRRSSWRRAGADAR
ncbi:acyltransferase [Curtobacterium sp. ISL-83]|uniref:acyltransferase family protein n=1 Tax=Curtobacterium sp. ISL-83 TaxID=2819145 RepID=UPI001BE4E72E|nr:acyltransferase [Curtobacterium sp. ISL-83]MBT2502055.1 acyltransferase [Curtobacterium sp. ISL-83]